MNIEEIQCYKIAVRSAVTGQTCSLKISFPDNEPVNDIVEQIKKGTVLVDEKPEYLIQEFTVGLTLCNTTEEVILSQNCEPIIFSETFKQSCVIKDNKKMELKLSRNISKSIDKTEARQRGMKKRSDSFFINQNWKKELDATLPSIILKPNIVNHVIVELKFKPEYVKKGQTIMIYDQNLKATGEVTELLF